MQMTAQRQFLTTSKFCETRGTVANATTKGGTLSAVRCVGNTYYFCAWRKKTIAHRNHIIYKPLWPSIGHITTEMSKLYVIFDSGAFQLLL